MGKKQELNAITAWLQNALVERIGSYNYRDGQWVDCHGGKTGDYPYCRPQGMKSADGVYHVRLVVNQVTRGPGSVRMVIEDAVIHISDISKKEPSIEDMFNTLLASLQSDS